MLSVVIPAFNEEKYIGACLEALLHQQAKEPFEVIVVDNASTDRTAEVAKGYAGKLNLRVIREEKKGRGAARAAGFKAARGDIIFSTDADCAPLPQWVQILTTVLRRDPHLAAVTTPFVIRDCSYVYNAILNFQWLLMCVYRTFFGHFWLNGSSFAIRKETYEAASGFNREVEAMEDTDLSRRVRHLGNIRLLQHPRMVT